MTACMHGTDSVVDKRVCYGAPRQSCWLGWEDGAQTSARQPVSVFWLVVLEMMVEALAGMVMTASVQLNALCDTTL